VGFGFVLMSDLGGWAWLRRRIRLPGWIRRRLHIPPARPWQRAEASADALSDAPSADQVYLATAERLLNTQVATNDILDTKTAGTVGVGTTILPLTFGLLSLAGKPIPRATGVLLGLAVAAYVVLLMTAARASRIRAIEYRPDVHELAKHSREIDGAALRRWIADEYGESVEINRPVLQRKVRWVGVVNVVLYAEGILISAAAALALIS
jgi:hypothetical protein